MRNKLGMLLAVGACTLGMAAPVAATTTTADAVSSPDSPRKPRQATVSEVDYYFFGYALHAGQAVETDTTGGGSTTISASCQVSTLNALVLVDSADADCSIRDVTSGARYAMADETVAANSGTAQGAFIVPESHAFELCVGAWYDHPGGGTLGIFPDCVPLD